MANVPLHFSATVRDGLGTEASTTAYLNPSDTTTLAGLVADLGTWLTDLDAVTDGLIRGTRIEITPALPGGLKTATGATFQASRVEQSAVLNFSATGTTRKDGMVIPAVSNAAIVAGKVDLTNAAITALIALLSGGNYTNPYNQVLVGLLDAILTFRKKRKQLQRSSFEV
jgi:hypothetical protein